MYSNKNIEDNIERALNSMEGHNRAAPGPYFATRINARLQSFKVPNIWDKLYALITKPIIAIAGIAIILLLNIIIITSGDNAETVKFQTDLNGEWQGFSATTNALYDVENMEP